MTPFFWVVSYCKRSYIRSKSNINIINRGLELIESSMAGYLIETSGHTGLNIDFRNYCGRRIKCLACLEGQAIYLNPLS